MPRNVHTCPKNSREDFQSSLPEFEHQSVQPRNEASVLLSEFPHHLYILFIQNFIQIASLERDPKVGNVDKNYQRDLFLDRFLFTSLQTCFCSHFSLCLPWISHLFLKNKMASPTFLFCWLGVLYKWA